MKLIRHTRYPCGFEERIEISGWTWTVKLNDDGVRVCPVHGKKCKSKKGGDKR